MNSRKHENKIELKVGETYNVKVIKIVDAGAVVELMEDRGHTELVHISNIADTFVRSAGDFVFVGSIYTATCQVGKTRPVELSFVPMKLTPFN